MKKILALLIVIIAISCKKETKDEPVKKEEIINLYADKLVLGKWVYSEVRINGKAIPYPHMKGCRTDYFQFFNSLGRDHEYVERIYLNSNCATSSTGMKWKIKGDQLILSFGIQDFAYKILRLTSTNFDVSVQVDYDADGKLDTVEQFSVREPCYTWELDCEE